MSNLQELQSAFKRYLFFENNAIASQISSTPPLDSEVRLAIYGNAYRSRLVETLAGDYAALHYLLGGEEFEKLGIAYIKAYPSTHYSLRWFGQDLALFLSSDQIYRERAYLPELAAFEWAFVDAFDARDESIAEMEDAAKIPHDQWPALKIVLQPSVRWVTCSWNCLALWKAMKEESPAPTPELLSAPVSYLIWRQETGIRYRSMETGETRVLDEIAEGSDFAEICNVLSEYTPPDQAALRAATLLKCWLSDGLISRLA